MTADNRTDRETDEPAIVAPSREAIAGQLLRYVHRGSIIAGLIGDSDHELVSEGDTEELDTLRQLLLLLDEPGQLDVTTATRRYRLIFSGSLDVAVALGTGPVSEIDLWLSQIAEPHRHEVTS